MLVFKVCRFLVSFLKVVALMVVNKVFVVVFVVVFIFILSCLLVLVVISSGVCLWLGLFRVLIRFCLSNILVVWLMICCGCLRFLLIWGIVGGILDLIIVVSMVNCIELSLLVLVVFLKMDCNWLFIWIILFIRVMIGWCIFLLFFIMELWLYNGIMVLIWFFFRKWWGCSVVWLGW